MPFIPFSNVAQFNIRADYLSVPIENVLNFRIGTGPITASNLNDAATILAEQWVLAMMGNFTSGYIFREVHAVDLTSATGPIATVTLGAGTAGGNGADNEPGNVAFCLSLRTASRGRSFRGRVFLPAIRSSETTDNHLSSTRISGFITAMETIMTEMLAADWTLVIASRRHNGIDRTAGVATAVTSVLAVDDRIDTQRRRLG